jgi:hypothetical protein
VCVCVRVCVCKRSRYVREGVGVQHFVVAKRMCIDASGPVVAAWNAFARLPGVLFRAVCDCSNLLDVVGVAFTGWVGMRTCRSICRSCATFASPRVAGDYVRAAFGPPLWRRLRLGCARSAIPQTRVGRLCSHLLCVAAARCDRRASGSTSLPFRTAWGLAKLAWMLVARNACTSFPGCVGPGQVGVDARRAQCLHFLTRRSTSFTSCAAA